MKTAPLILLALLTATGWAGPATLVLQPGPDTGKDAHVVGGKARASENKGSSGKLHLSSNLWSEDGKDPGKYAAHPFLLFDLSELKPLAKEVSKATLKLHIAGGRENGPDQGPKDWHAYRVLEAWDETTISWSKQPKADAQEVATAKFHEADIGKWVEWDLTPLTKDWFQGFKPNHGILLYNKAQFPDVSIQFHSSDSEEAALRPILEIVYEAVPIKLVNFKLQEEASLREWTNARGQSTFARLLGVLKGRVYIQLEDQEKPLGIPFEKLSDDDKSYVKTVMRKHQEGIPLGDTPLAKNETPQVAAAQRAPEKAVPAPPAGASDPSELIVINSVGIVSDSGSSRLSPVENLFGDKGLKLPMPSGDPLQLHTHSRGADTMWLSKRGPIDKQYVVFDLGKSRNLHSIHLWPYGVTANAPYSVKKFLLYGSEKFEDLDLDSWKVSWLRLEPASGAANFEMKEPGGQGTPLRPENFELKDAIRVRYVLLDVLSNHGDAPYAGLSKVRFSGTRAMNP